MAKEEKVKEATGLLNIPYQQAIFVSQLIINRLFSMLEAVSDGLIGFVDEELNNHYIMLSDNLKEFFKREDLAELKELDPFPDILPNHLFDDAENLDIYWEWRKNKLLSLIGNIQAVWVRAGQQSFQQAKEEKEYFQLVDNVIEKHRKEASKRTAAFMKNVTAAKERGEFDFPETDDDKSKQYWIIKNKKGAYCFEGNEIHIKNPNAGYMRIFYSVFSLMPKGGEIPFKEIIEKCNEDKIQKVNKAAVQRALVGKSSNFFQQTKVPLKPQNTSPLFETAQNGKYLRFRNKR